MKRLFVILLILIISIGGYSQNSGLSFSTNQGTISIPSNSIKNNRKNAVYIESFWVFPAIYFDRTFPISNTIGLVGKVGATYSGEPILDAELGFLLGRSKHFFEFGAISFTDFNDPYYGGHIGYRYIGEKGLLLKAGFMYWGEWIGDFDSTFPRIGIGYSF